MKSILMAASLFVCGCASVQHTPLSIPQALMPPTILKGRAAAVSELRDSITLSWEYDDNPNIVFNLYSSTNLVDWKLHTQYITSKIVTIPISSTREYFRVSAYDIVNKVESSY